MNVKNCPGCRKMYVPNALGMCEACMVKEEEGFVAIRDFIEENNSCTLGELSKATGVPIKKILGYIREGRLMPTPGMANEVTCKTCDEPITKGNFCDACTIKLNKDIQGLYGDREEKMEVKRTGIKMHIKDKLR